MSSQRRVSQTKRADSNPAGAVPNNNDAEKLDNTAGVNEAAAEPVTGSKSKPKTGKGKPVSTPKAKPAANGSSAVNGSAIAPALATPARYRIAQNFADHVATRKKAVNVPLIRPDDQQWVFIPGADEWRDSVGMLKDKQSREWYVVEPELLPEISETLIPVLLVTYITRGGSPGLWPVRLPNESGRLDSFNRSALEIVLTHTDKWIRVIMNADGRGYEILEMASAVEMPKPKLPEEGFAYLFGVAIKANRISSLQHPLLKNLRGEQI